MWMRPSVNGGPAPSARCAHAMAACDKSKLYSFGGWNGQKMMNDLYIFFYGDSTQMSWHRPVTTGTIPGPRAGHTMSAIGNRLLVFGGGDGSQYLNDLHILDTETMVWSQAYVAGTSPAARSRHTATVIGSRLFIFGGGDDSRVFNDVYMLDTDTMSWSRPVMKGNLPAARWGHTATLIGDGKLLVFGGHDGTKMLADVHILDIQTMTWSQPTIASKNVDGTPALVPSARAGHTSTYLNSFGKLLMFGGGDGSKILNDIWLLDLTTFLWIRPSISGNAPPGRCAHATFLIENKLIVFGGGDGNRRFKDLYILDVENVLAVADQNKTKTKKANPPKKRTIDPTKVLEERPKDITTFLTNLGMKKYLDKFISQEIDVDTLPLLTETHLEQLGVSTIGARLKILAAVKSLKPDVIEETREKDSSDNIQLLNESIDTLCSSTNRLTEALKMLTYSNHPTPATTPKSALQSLPQPMQHNLLPSKLELQNY